MSTTVFAFLILSLAVVSSQSSPIPESGRVEMESIESNEDSTEDLISVLFVDSCVNHDWGGKEVLIDPKRSHECINVDLTNTRTMQIKTRPDGVKLRIFANENCTGPEITNWIYAHENQHQIMTVSFMLVGD